MTIPKFTGFSPEGMLLLQENKFRNDKLFYEAHKAELKKLSTDPMRLLCAALAPMFAKWDEHMVLDPVKMVSRIRRDTRFTNDKTLYRAHMWAMFMRPKDEMPFPAMWFEFNPEQQNWSCGICTFGATPVFMAAVREKILANPTAFLEAVESAKSRGALEEIEAYKKIRFAHDNPTIQLFLNAKSFDFISMSDDLSLLYDSELVDVLSEAYRAFTALFAWLVGLC
jgi:uncharacterized protein (DUF2461 family)